jgi:phosphatidylserine synthase
MDKTLFLAAQTLALFLLSMSLLPWLLKRGHWALSVILPLCVFLIFAQFNPNNFDFIQRLWRGLGIGVLCVTWGFVLFYLSKRETKNSKS